MSASVVIKNTAYCLAHVPDLVRYGSKPRRERHADASVETKIAASLRSYDQARAYLPNQVFIGGASPHQLAECPRPWFESRALSHDASSRGRFGEIAPAELFYALLKRADVLEPPLFRLNAVGAERLTAALRGHPVLSAREFQPDPEAAPAGDERTVIPIASRTSELGWFVRDLRAEGRDDESLATYHLLENLCSKASGALALEWLLHREGLAAGDVDYIISCGEEAVGDRYQRGGGGMAKAIGEMCGCVRASGMDIKNFCAAPASALITAGALIRSGLYRNVVVVAGGSLAKLGMKFQQFLAHGMPILEDCLAALAVLVSSDDGESPVLRLEPGAIGSTPIGASATDEAVYRNLLLAPLEALGLRISDVDRFAPELHNAEIMELSGSGDVAHKNYRSIAAMAVLAGEIEKRDMDALIARVGMPGFAPTQGHIPSAVAYLGHASDLLRSGEARRIMFLAKASLFLGRLTELYDGVSFLVEANPARRV